MEKLFEEVLGKVMGKMYSEGELIDMSELSAVKRAVKETLSVLAEMEEEEEEKEKSITREEAITKVKEVIAQYIEDADCGCYFTRNICGDRMSELFEDLDNKIEVDICYGYNYFEIFGLTEEEEKEITEFYQKEKEECRRRIIASFEEDEDEEEEEEVIEVKALP